MQPLTFGPGRARLVRFRALSRTGVRSLGFTLVEVMISAAVMTIMFLGLFTMLIQSRRLTEGSIIQASAVTVLQGYIEQMKNMDFNSVAVSLPDAATYNAAVAAIAAGLPAPPITVPTVQDDTHPDALNVSWGTPPTTIPGVLGSSAAGAIVNPALGTASPTGAIDNIKNIDMKSPATNDPSDKLNLNVWLWIEDLTGTATDVTNSKSITLIYTYTFLDGGRTYTYRGSLRTIRSVVPSY